MSKGRVLVVDDEQSIRRAVGRALTARGYQVELATDGEQALTAAAAFQPDLVVLDLNLPALDGLSVCRQLRGWSSVPILILSVREDEADKVAALDLGADDYLTKPFGIDELMARVRALLRRAGAQGAPRPVRFRSGDLEIDLDERRVTRSGVEVRLTRTEWVLLAELCQRPGKLLTHGWLLERVWGPGYAGDVDVLRVFISQLRKKLERDPGAAAADRDRPGHRLPLAAATQRRSGTAQLVASRSVGMVVAPTGALGGALSAARLARVAAAGAAPQPPGQVAGERERGLHRPLPGGAQVPPELARAGAVAAHEPPPSCARRKSRVRCQDRAAASGSCTSGRSSLKNAWVVPG